MKVLQYIGKFLISVGFGILLFVGWTLWGTGIYTRQQQAELGRELDNAPSITAQPNDDSDAAGVVRVPDTFLPGPGDPVFKLHIPTMSSRTFTVVEGVGVEELKKGPGHYPECRTGFARPLCTDFEEMWPGEEGRVVVSGHRTTYDAPFWDLDKVQVGDQVITETQWGDFVYEVYKKEVVVPNSLAIVIDRDHPEIVLTTCNPKYSASQRLVVFAELVEATAR